jgi:mono/diheme cytochrome c family protein
MKRLLTIGCVGLTVACLTASMPVAETRAAAGVETPSVRQESSTNDGVFTSAQARRGSRIYSRDCASCHGPEMKGGEMAPGIAGSDFIVFWVDLPVGSLFERIKVSMPEDGPGRLSDEEYTDVVAFLLDTNDYPSGDTELPADKAELDKIMIVAAE